jgi:hypothetical protein
MKEEKKDLITFSEAARLRKVSPQTISDYVKRKRLEIVEDSGKKYLDRQAVENLEVKQSGRPLKAEASEIESFFRKLNSELEKTERPEDFYPKLFKVFIKCRRPALKDFVVNHNFPQPWINRNWRRNKRALRDFLKSKNHSLTWQQETIITDIFLTRKYTDPLIQEFFAYCMRSEKMYEEVFFVSRLQHDFVSHTQLQIAYEADANERNRTERQLIIAMFKECLDANCFAIECKGRNPNPLVSGFRVVQAIQKDKTILSRLTGLKKTERIKRILFENTAIGTKSTVVLRREWLKVMREVRKK